MEGWIKLHRKIMDWRWFSSPNHYKLWTILLMRATHKESEHRDIKLLPGQLITGRKQLASWSGFSEQQVRGILEDFRRTSEVTIKTTKKFSIITIINWNDYNISNQENNQQITNKQPTDNQQVTTFKNVKNVKKPKNNTLSEVGLFEVEQQSLDEDCNAPELAIKVLTALNTICFRNFRPKANTLKPINARINEGYAYEDFVAVITHFQKKWGNDPKFSDYLQPSTLFNGKFDERLVQSQNALKPKIDPLDALAEMHGIFASNEVSA